MKSNLGVEKFKEISVLNIYDSRIRNWKIDKGITFVKVVLPATVKAEMLMKNQGYERIDSRFDCYVNTNENFEKINYRFLPRLERGGFYDDEILKISETSFCNDTRFNFLLKCSEENYRIALQNAIEDSEYKIVCVYNGILIGFILLKPKDRLVLEVKLAAVLQKYRASGVGVELYMKALELCEENHLKFLYGNIDVLNLSAINLYCFLKAKFVSVKDTYLKRMDNNET